MLRHSLHCREEEFLLAFRSRHNSLVTRSHLSHLNQQCKCSVVHVCCSPSQEKNIMMTSQEIRGMLKYPNLDIHWFIFSLSDIDYPHSYDSNCSSDYQEYLEESNNKNEVNDDEASSQGVQLKNLKWIATLGVGGFGRVELVTLKSSNQDDQSFWYAIKINLSENVFKIKFIALSTIILFKSTEFSS